MRTGLRGMAVWLGGALAAAPVPALAQSTAGAQQTPTPAPSDSVGPAELQNFSLKGTVTKPAEQAPPTPAPQPMTQSVAKAVMPPAAKPERLVESHAPVVHAPPAATNTAEIAAPPASAQAAASPPPAQVTAPAFQQPLTTAPPLPNAPASNPVTPLAPERNVPILPWIAAALALVAAAAFLLWRRRSQREAFAGAHLFVPPEPALQPAPVPTPRPAPPQLAPEPAKPAPASRGIVSTRLRPQVEIKVQPLHCRVDGEQVVLDFELELFNAGAAPARAVHAETALFNAGAAQDQELAAFFTNPVGAGERLDIIPAMKRVTFASQVVAPRSAIQEYELAGRKTIVPVLAFNALYEWSGGKAQTSAAFLVGRETNKDKLGPLALNGAAREFHELGVRTLPSELRN